MAGMTTQAMWVEKWAMLIVDAQYHAIKNREMKFYMETLLANGLLLVTPPARVWHSVRQQGDFREHIVDQLLRRIHLSTLYVSETLLWNHPNGALVVASRDLKATRIQATTILKLEAGALNYNTSLATLSRTGKLFGPLSPCKISSPTWMRVRDKITTDHSFQS